jgi:hypothetical protein
MWLQRDFEFSGTTWIMTSPGVSSQAALDSEKAHAMMKPCLHKKRLFLIYFTFETTRDRCFDFLNIFAENFSVFGSKQSQILKKIDYNIGF